MRYDLLACLALIGCSPASAVDRHSPEPEHAVQIIDGGSFTLDGETIRIANVDAPASGSEARCWAEARLSTQARWALESLSATWRFRAPELSRTGQDAEGRTLARVTVDGEDVGAALVEAGHVAPMTRGRWDWCGPITNDPAGERILNARPDPFTAMMTEAAREP